MTTLMMLTVMKCSKNMNGLDKPEYEQQLYWKEALEVIVVFLPILGFVILSL